MLGFFGMGHWEVLIVAFVILLLFGHRLPSMMRSLGRGVVEFKHGLHGEEDDGTDKLSESDKADKAEKVEADG